MGEVARTDRSVGEIEDSLECAMENYKRHLKLHRMKTDMGRLERFVVWTAEAAENLVTLKFSEAAKRMFSFRREEIALLEAEATAPGREVAYIVKANERL